jgi:hypothetical protein
MRGALALLMLFTYTAWIQNDLSCEGAITAFRFGRPNTTLLSIRQDGSRLTGAAIGRTVEGAAGERITLKGHGSQAPESAGGLAREGDVIIGERKLA